MKNKIIIFGAVLTLVGLVLILISLTEKDNRKLQGIVPRVSIEEQWYDAQIIVDGKSYLLRQVIDPVSSSVRRVTGTFEKLWETRC